MTAKTMNAHEAVTKMVGFSGEKFLEMYQESLETMGEAATDMLAALMTKQNDAPEEVDDDGIELVRKHAIVIYRLTALARIFQLMHDEVLEGIEPNEDALRAIVAAMLQRIGVVQ